MPALIGRSQIPSQKRGFSISGRDDRGAHLRRDDRPDRDGRPCRDENHGRDDDPNDDRARPVRGLHPKSVTCKNGGVRIPPAKGFEMTHSGPPGRNQPLFNYLNAPTAVYNL
jgi:hypothetical protein